MKKFWHLINQTSASLITSLTLVLLVFIPLYPKLPALEVSQTYVHVRLEDFLVAGTVFLALPVIWTKRKELIKQPTGRAIVIYWLAGLAATLSGLLISQLIWPHLALLHYLRRIEYMSLFFIGFLAVRNRKDFRIFSVALFITVGLIFLYALGQKFYSLPVISTMNEEFSKGTPIELDTWTRVSATFAGHYDLAIYMTIVIPPILAGFFTVRSKFKKILLAILFICCYYLLILTASRVSFIAYLGSVSLLLIFLKKKWWLVPIISLSILGSLFSEDINQRFAATIKVEGPKVVQKITGTLISLLPQEKQEKLAQKIDSTPTPIINTAQEESGKEENANQVSSPTTGAIKPSPIPTPISTPSKEETAQIGVERSGNIRFGVEWPRAIRHFRKNPILGTGYSSITLATDNGYLRALGETGLIGFLALIGIFISQIPFYLKAVKETDRQGKFLALAMATSTLALLASIMFIDALESSKIAFSYWLLLGLITARVSLNYGKAKNK